MSNPAHGRQSNAPGVSGNAGATSPSRVNPSDALSSAMRASLEARARKSSLRALTVTPPNSVDFSSNDFLSLSTSTELHTSFLANLGTAPPRLGSGGSRLLDGNSTYAITLENDIAAFHGAEAGCFFNSGFDANSGFFSCVPQRGDVIVYDEFIHASVHEGMRLSRAKVRKSFAHNNIDDLEQVLRDLVASDELVKRGDRSVFVAVESLYSMDGDLAPLKDIVDVVDRILSAGNGKAVVDEAHSNGVYGEKGRGLVCSLGLETRFYARLHTFGKALACNGAIMLCSPLAREYLINYARPLIYTTFMSYPSLVAIRTVYDHMMLGNAVAPVAHLWNLVTHLHTLLLNLQLSPSHPLFQIPQKCPQSPIFSLLSSQPRKLARECQEAGFMVRAIVSPTVPVGAERVRVCLHAGNSLEDVKRLVEVIGGWVKNADTGSVGAVVRNWKL